MCPLEKGVRGINIGHQTTGRVRVFATANTWRTQRPHGVSLLGHHQMPAEEQRSGSPALWCARKPDRSLEKGVGGFKTFGTESQ